MAMFGVQLNAQINRLTHQIKVKLSKDKTKIYFRDLVKQFFRYDQNQLGKLHMYPFQKALNNCGLFFKVWEIQVIYKAFGKDNDDHIYWQQFLNLIRQPMQQFRRQTVKRVWKFLDVRQQGSIHFKQLTNLYDVTPMRDYKVGLKNRQQLVDQFIDRLKINQEGKVTQQQFIEYYDDFNVNLPGDKTFRDMLFKQWNYDQQLWQQPKIEEIKAVLRQLRFKLIQKTQGTHEQFLLKKVYDEFDINKDGQILFQKKIMLVGNAINGNQTRSAYLVKVASSNFYKI